MRNSRKMKCWKCGNEYEAYMQDANPRCPKCHKFLKDGKPSVQRKNKIGLILMIAGILVIFLSTYIPFLLGTNINGFMVLTGLIIVGIGFGFRVLASMDAHN